MKKLLTLTVLICAFSFSAEAQFKFGAGISFLVSELGFGARGHYTIDDQFAGQASFNYYLQSGITLWDLNLDVHYSGFDIGDVESFALTPFAGINFFNASVLGISASTTNLNIGVNGTMPLTDSLDLYIEPKITIGNGGAFGIAAGVYF